MMKLVVPQKILGPRSFLACALTINILFILALDMYVPALPGMQRDFGVSASFLNITVFLFLVVSAVGMILAGPVSDRIGRRPALVACCVVFAVSSFACAAATSVAQLAVFRMMEALAFGGVTTLESALIKDAYSDEDLDLAMSALQSLIIIGPVFAPFLGSLVLSFASWRAIFAVLGVFGIVGVALATLMSETYPRELRLSGGVLNSLRSTWSNAVILMKRRTNAAMSLYIAVAGVPYFAFIATASYIILDQFGLSYMNYSVIYAIASIVTTIAPFVYVRLSRTCQVSTIMRITLVLSASSAVLLGTVGTLGPWLFLIAFLPYALMEGICRPMGFVILLDQEPGYVGAASASTNFIYSVVTSFGTVLGTLAWSNYIVGIAAIAAGSTVAMFVLYQAGGKHAGRRTRIG